MKTPSLLPSLLAVCAAIAVLGGNCFGHGPEQHHTSHQKGSCQKGGKHCGCEPVHKSCFWEFCKPHAPPFLPVIQSLAVRNLPPVTDASQMQLSVKMQEAPQRDEADQRGSPSQKDDAQQKGAVQAGPTTIWPAGVNVSHTDERFRRLESQVDLLLKKMDEVLQRETRQARQIHQEVDR